MQPFLQHEEKSENYFDKNQKLGNNGELWSYKKHFGLVYLPKPSVGEARMRVVCSRLKIHDVRKLPGCSEVEVRQRAA